MLFFRHKRNKKTIYTLSLAAILVIVGICVIIFGNGFGNDRGLRVCPEEMIVNEMPGIDRSGETESDIDPMRTSYYILGGERREIDEFDTAYIAENCTVPVSSVY